MAREIKFRAWDGERMIYGLTLTNGDMGYFPHCDNDKSVDMCGGHTDFIKPIVMQYIDELDGVQIYEDDIVSLILPNGNILGPTRVEYDEQVCGFWPMCSDSDVGESRNFQTVRHGNIYENPELKV